MKSIIYGILAAVLTLLAFLTITRLFAEETPPYHVEDPAIEENFRRIYQLVDQVRQNDGSHIFVSTSNSTLFNNADVYGSSVTIAPGASVTISVSGLKANWLPIFSEMETSSKTVSCVAGPSSFTLTNTSGVESKKVNFWVLGRK